MRCRKVRRNLAAYLDGEVREGLGQKIAGHLEGCSACRAESQALTRVSAAVRELGIPPFPDSGLSAEKILGMARAQGRPAPAQRDSRAPRWTPSQPLWKPAFAFASVLFVIVFWRVYPFIRSLPMPSQEEIQVAERLDLFENLELIEDLSVMELIMSGEGQDERPG